MLTTGCKIGTSGTSWTLASGTGLSLLLMKVTKAPESSRTPSEWGAGDGDNVTLPTEFPESDELVDADPDVGPREDSPTFWEMTSEAAVTSWLKFSGPVAVAFHGLSCLVDHCNRCW
jgi:hypothetical protein